MDEQIILRKKKEEEMAQKKNVKLDKGPGPMKWRLLKMRDWRGKKRKVTNSFT